MKQQGLPQLPPARVKLSGGGQTGHSPIVLPDRTFGSFHIHLREVNPIGRIRRCTSAHPERAVREQVAIGLIPQPVGSGWRWLQPGRGRPVFPRGHEQILRADRQEQRSQTIRPWSVYMQKPMEGATFSETWRTS